MILRPEDFGAVGSGDDTPAVQAAISACLESRPINGLIPNAATVVYFNPHTTYRVRELRIPRATNIHFRSEPYGALIKNIGDTPWIFSAGGNETNYRALSFSGLTLARGGVNLGGGALPHSQQPWSRFDNCMFFNSPSDAIRIGERVVFGRVVDCRFDTTGGVNFAARDSDLWQVNGCQFLRSTAPSVQIGSSGVRVDGCDFEQSDYPFISVSRGPDVRICRNRFGNEGAVPRVIIDAGGDESLTGLRVYENCFRGRGDVAIRFGSAPISCAVHHNEFWDYETFCVDEYDRGKARGNVWQANGRIGQCPSNASRDSIFANGGQGWTLPDIVERFDNVDGALSNFETWSQTAPGKWLSPISWNRGIRCVQVTARGVGSFKLAAYETAGNSHLIAHDERYSVGNSWQEYHASVAPYTTSGGVRLQIASVGDVEIRDVRALY